MTSSLLDRASLGVIIAGALSLLWYHRVMIDTSIVPPIIDEYMVTIRGQWIAEGLLPYRDFFQFHFPGSFYLYAAAGTVFSGSMIAMRAVNNATTLLLGFSLFAWYRGNGQGFAESLGIALLVAGPCVYLWPIITPHPPAMLALAVGTTLLLRATARLAWFSAGLLLFFAAWSVQTVGVLVLALLAGALLIGIGTAKRRIWAPWVFAGAGLPAALWIGSLFAFGQWEPFLKQAVLFVVSGGYRQAGGTNDASFLALASDRIEREVGWAGKSVFAGATAACVFALWGTPILAALKSGNARLVLLLPALVAPVVFITGRTDAHHAYHLAVPGLMLLGTPWRDRRVHPALRTLGLAAMAALALAFCFATTYHLVVAIDRGFVLRDDRRELAAVNALAELGVSRSEPVAVLPWAANLYYLGVVPGHYFPYVGAAGQGYHGEREWETLRQQMRATGTRWIAFYPSREAGKFVSDGRLPAYLVGETGSGHFVGRSGPIELWRID